MKLRFLRPFPAFHSIRLMAGLACALLALACAGKFLPKPGEDQAAAATRAGRPSTVSTLDQGRDLYIEKCDDCHTLPAVQDHSPEEWELILNKMKREAGLTPREDYLVRAYVVTSSAWLRDSLNIR